MVCRSVVAFVSGVLLGPCKFNLSGLEIRVVLWPQSTKSFVGPPDSLICCGPVVYWETFDITIKHLFDQFFFNGHSAR